jgi:hypothetical protein
MGSEWDEADAGMKEFGIVVAIVGVWFLLQAVILPALGIST